MRKKLSLILTLNLLLCIGVITASGVAYAAAGNSQYSLSGTQYQLYTDEACTVEAMDADGISAVLTTDADDRACIQISLLYDMVRIRLKILGRLLDEPFSFYFHMVAPFIYLK